jgi:sugar O-acyltransferase (sialic acid O-acetyltransferase NeuD family)
MKTILVFGAGGHAKVVLDILERQRRYEVIGLVGRKHENGTILGYPIIGSDEDSALLARWDCSGIIAVGDNAIRSRIAGRVIRSVPCFRFVSAIHPRASIGKGVMVGDGSVIMAGVVINTGAVIGQHCIINTNASVDHDSRLEDFVFVAPGVSIGGNARVGAWSAIYIGACVAPGISIGENTIVGAGATVVRDLPAGVVAYGNPAKVVRRLLIEEQNL